MRLADPIYGVVELDEPFIEELLVSAPLQRMKGIHQAGANYLIDPKQTGTRYTHCVGVMLLLRGAGASLEEQAAGLLHDVGHGAFSHVLDLVFPQYDHNFDDAHLGELIANSEIPSIYEKYGFDWKKVVEKKSFGLLERPSPRLCADRIDYTFRDSLYSLDASTIRRWWEDLRVHDGEFVFASPQLAAEFALQYLHMDDLIWSSPRFATGYRVFADALKEAVALGIISRADLHTSDEEVLEKLRLAQNPLIQSKLALLNGNFDAIRSDDFDFRLSWKVKWVDPLVLMHYGPVPISILNPAVKEAIDAHNGRMQHGLMVKMVARS